MCLCPLSNVNKEENGKERTLKKWNKRPWRIKDKKDFPKKINIA